MHLFCHLSLLHCLSDSHAGVSSTFTWTQTCAFQSWVAAGFRQLLCAQVNVLCPRGPWALLLWLFSLVSAKSKDQAQEQMSWGFWDAAFLLTSTTKPWSELEQHPLCFMVAREQPGLPLPLCLWEGSCWDGILCRDRSWAMWGMRDLSAHRLHPLGGDIMPLRAKPCCYSAAQTAEGSVSSLCLHCCAAFLELFSF